MRSMYAISNLFVLIAIVICVPIMIGVYVFRDASRRGMNAAVWTLVAVLAPSLIGFLIYLLVRREHPNLKCPACNTRIGEDFVVCPSCGAKLHPSCPNCATPVEPDWRVCPRCAQPLPGEYPDVHSPIRPKDRSLWKILLVIILVPIILILVLGLSFSTVTGGGSSSTMHTTIDGYFEDQEIPEETKEYVRSWLDNLPDDDRHVYALEYEHTYTPARSDGRKDYYYLIFIPNGGNVTQRGYGYTSGLFSDSYQLQLETRGDQDGLFCVATTSKHGSPAIKVTLNDEELSAEITRVDFNPTLYTIASEADYSTLTNASGDLYVEVLEQEMKPTSVSISKMDGDQELDVQKFNEADVLLDTVAGIHELQYLDEVPSFLNDYSYNEHYKLVIHYADTTGEAHYEDQSVYRLVEENGAYYLVESADIVYEITPEAYSKLTALFD